MDGAMVSSTIAAFLLPLLLLVVLTTRTSSAPEDGADTCSAAAEPDPRALHAELQASCRLFLAQSTIPNSGLGMFTSTPLSRAAPVGWPDVVIQLPDIAVEHADGIRVLLQEYLWDSQETGGMYEGKQVYSVIPGVGMLANGDSRLNNVLLFRPEVDEADLPRTTAPGSGAITHYHNCSFYAQKPLQAGDEIFVNYGLPWFQERDAKFRANRAAASAASNDDEEAFVPNRSVEWLRHHALCLDNLRAKRSTNPKAGRGAFATRFIPRGAVIAPAPVVQIAERESLKTYRVTLKDELVKGHQLLLNYCLGHKNSSLLLYPYSPLVNLINHEPENVNAELRWSTSDQHRGRNWPTTLSLDEVKSLNSTGLMLEFVAARNISAGEEIFINYGKDWQEAWDRHEAAWKPVPGAQAYTPSYVMDDVARVVRTEEEQREHATYGDNVVTSCFYRYADHKDMVDPSSSSSSSSSKETTTFRWNMTRGIFEFRNLRPCSILKRDPVDGKKGGGWYYTALIRNRYGMAQEERIPKGVRHIVTHIPRQAIRFADKLYKTDQHLPNAFRHEIGIPDHIFPKQWMDLGG